MEKVIFFHYLERDFFRRYHHLLQISSFDLLLSIHHEAFLNFNVKNFARGIRNCIEFSSSFYFPNPTTSSCLPLKLWFFLSLLGFISIDKVSCKKVHVFAGIDLILFQQKYSISKIAALLTLVIQKTFLFMQKLFAHTINSLNDVDDKH